MYFIHRAPIALVQIVKYSFASPYHILGVNPSSTKSQIKEAYYRLAQQYHPDKNQSQDAQRKFQEILEAYEKLNASNFKKFDAYDEFHQQDEQPRKTKQKNRKRNFDFDFENFEKIFQAKSKGGKFRKRGEDIKMGITLSFRESIFGVQKILPVSKLVICDVCEGNQSSNGYKQYKCMNCNGSGWLSYRDQNSQIDIKCNICNGFGKVVRNKCEKCRGHGVILRTSNESIQVPKAVNQGQVLRVQFGGNASLQGGKQGDLFLKVNVLEDPYFKKEGNNIISNLNLTISEAVLGVKKTINTIWGETEIEIPPAMSPKSRLSIPQLGIVGGNNQKKGDHILILDLMIPSELDDQTRQLFNEISKYEN